jgi:hypothetical protein
MMSIFYFPDKQSKSDSAKRSKENMRNMVDAYRKTKKTSKSKVYKPETRLEKRLFEDY